MDLDFPCFSYLNIDGELDSAYQGPLTLEQLLHGYKVMQLTRYLDERMITLQRQGEITFAMSAFGEEACSVASAAACELTDWMYPQYREAGILFWRGYSVQSYVHMMFGDRLDPTLGRQMPNHFGSKELNVVTVSSPIGTKIPHAAGCAYAMKLQKEKAISICYFGEGATSEGDFHAGLNFAAVRKAPVIFFCRNNGYAISTPSHKQFASKGIAIKGASYGMPGFCIDGNDFFAVHEAVRRSREYCLSGEGPVLIEAMTYRMGAHSTSDDPSLYRPLGEEESWKEKSPILRLRKYLEKKGVWDEEKEKILFSEMNLEITNAIEIAKHTAASSLNHIVEGVTFAVAPNLIEEYLELRNLFKEGEDVSCLS